MQATRVLVVAVALLGVLVLVNGECCYARGGTCGDCTRGTPRCGYGRCNIFGCDCPPVPPHGHVCRFGQCFRQKRSAHILPSFVATGDEEVSITTGEDVVLAGDSDKDGALSLAEAASFLLENYNVTSGKRSLFEGLQELDKNHDGLLSAEEIDPK